MLLLAWREWKGKVMETIDSTYSREISLPPPPPFFMTVYVCVCAHVFMLIYSFFFKEEKKRTQSAASLQSGTTRLDFFILDSSLLESTTLLGILRTCRHCLHGSTFSVEPLKRPMRQNDQFLDLCVLGNSHPLLGAPRWCLCFLGVSKVCVPMCV